VEVRGVSSRLLEAARAFIPNFNGDNWRGDCGVPLRDITISLATGGGGLCLLLAPEVLEPARRLCPLAIGLFVCGVSCGSVHLAFTKQSIRNDQSATQRLTPHWHGFRTACKALVMWASIHSFSFLCSNLHWHINE
jgi:hypothetical protein